MTPLALATVLQIHPCMHPYSTYAPTPLAVSEHPTTPKQANQEETRKKRTMKETQGKKHRTLNYMLFLVANQHGAPIRTTQQLPTAPLSAGKAVTHQNN